MRRSENVVLEALTRLAAVGDDLALLLQPPPASQEAGGAASPAAPPLAAAAAATGPGSPARQRHQRWQQ